MDSFFNAEKEIDSDRFTEINFAREEREAYLNFSRQIHDKLSKIEKGAKYADDHNRIQKQLEEAYRNFMLEDTVPDTALVLRPFLNGTYYYNKSGFPVACVKEFLRLFKSSPPEKKRIILANLHTKIDTIPRYSDNADDDIPF